MGDMVEQRDRSILLIGVPDDTVYIAEEMKRRGEKVRVLLNRKGFSLRGKYPIDRCIVVTHDPEDIHKFRPLVDMVGGRIKKFVVATYQPARFNMHIEGVVLANIAGYPTMGEIVGAMLQPRVSN